MNTEKNPNSLFTKLSQCLKRQQYFFRIKNAYFLFGVPDFKTSINEIKELIAGSSLGDLKAREVYDVLADNIELYLIEETNGNLFIVVLLDPFELFVAERILDVLPIGSLTIDKTKIYSN